MTTPIRTEIIPISIEYFRDVMKRLSVLCGGIWVSSSCDHLRFDEKRETLLGRVGDPDRGPVVSVDVTRPTRGTWVVCLMRLKDDGTPDGKWAAIEAYEMPNGQSTRIDCLDGYFPDLLEMPPIGRPFVEFCDWVIREVWPEVAEPTLAGEGAGDHQEIEQIPFSGFPQTQEKREEWAEIYYDVIVPLREKHRRERNSMLPYYPPDDPDLPDLEPTWKECREEIVSQKETSYQESTIRRMIRAGDNKDLQEYRVGK